MLPLPATIVTAVAERVLQLDGCSTPKDGDMIKTGILAMTLLLGSSLASGLLYTSKSVYRSPFCKQYRCTFAGSKVMWNPALSVHYRRYTYQLPAGRMHVTRDIRNHKITGVRYLITDGDLQRGSQIGVAAVQTFLNKKIPATALLNCWTAVKTLDGRVFNGDDTTTYGGKCFFQNRLYGFSIFANS